MVQKVPMIKSLPYKRHYTECLCHSDEHALKWKWDTDLENDDPNVYLSYFLEQYHPWYVRIWIAMKYIFGYKSKCGHFDCTMLNDQDVADLVDFLVEFQNRGAKISLKEEHDGELLQAISDLAEAIELEGEEYFKTTPMDAVMKHKEIVNAAFGYVNKKNDNGEMTKIIESCCDDH